MHTVCSPANGFGHLELTKAPQCPQISSNKSRSAVLQVQAADMNASEHDQSTRLIRKSFSLPFDRPPSAGMRHGTPGSFFCNARKHPTNTGNLTKGHQGLTNVTHTSPSHALSGLQNVSFVRGRQPTCTGQLGLIVTLLRTWIRPMNPRHSCVVLKPVAVTPVYRLLVHQVRPHNQVRAHRTTVRMPSPPKWCNDPSSIPLSVH